jgi:hypothetical protein
MMKVCGYEEGQNAGLMAATMAYFTVFVYIDVPGR